MSDPLKINALELRSGDISPVRMRPAQPLVQTGETRSFAETLAQTVTEVQRLQNEADTTINKVVSGEIKDVSEAMVQLQKADTAFKTMMTVRGKVMDAYQEIMRMQI